GAVSHDRADVQRAPRAASLRRRRGPGDLPRVSHGEHAAGRPRLHAGIELRRGHAIVQGAVRGAGRAREIFAAGRDVPARLRLAVCAPRALEHPARKGVAGRVHDRHGPRPGARTLANAGATVMTVGAAAGFSAISLFRYVHFGANGFDLGIQDQTVWGYSRLEMIANTVLGVPNLLGDHFNPILMVLAPFY